MQNFSKSIFVVFLLLLLSFTPLIQVFYTTPSTMAIIRRNSTNELKTTANIVENAVHPNITKVNLQNINISDTLVLRYDSNVVMNNTIFDGNYVYIYLYNNSRLLLQNVTFQKKARVYVYDNAELIIKNGVAATDYVYFYFYDSSSAVLESLSGDFYINAFGESKVTAVNSNFITILTYDYTEETVYNSTASQTQLNDSLLHH